MASVDFIATASRRGFLSLLGFAGASAATATVIHAGGAEDSREQFSHPSEYVAAMQAIGWCPLAMFIPLQDGTICEMGVLERAPSGEGPLPTWEKFHAIQMRAPVQIPMDVHPGGWWGMVWQFLYDNGAREDVTPKRTIEEI